MKEISISLLSLPRYSKQVIAVISDSVLCAICTWLAFVIRLEEVILLRDFNYFSVLVSIIIALPIFWLFGLYRTIFRFAGLSMVFTIFSSIFLYGFIYFLIVGVYGIKGVPRSIGIIQPMLLFFSIMSLRLVVKYLLNDNLKIKIAENKKNILIYGAGDAGRQLANALENSHEFKVLGFLDDNHQLHGKILINLTIYNPIDLEKILLKKDISIIFLALPSVNRGKRNQIIKNLENFKLIVKSLPSISEIANDKITLSDIKDLNVDDLLSRDEVKADVSLINKNINSKIVLVTGAGGSIGSELSRQIIKLSPNKLLLLELNEFALYKIYNELKNFDKKLSIIPLLANAQDQSKLEQIFETFKVDTVYHAGAYKHVPLVEENICEGVKNNVFSTLSIAKASILKNVSNLVFISSDKAVRPTNIMGASKRLSELCIQGIHDKMKNYNTHFSIVRFGNVLESSGSVIPKFKKQINEGGPVTLTHEEVTRYFMTLNEAAQLVIQAGAMGKDAEVFVLDMGKSIKIRDLIIKMITLSGLSIKDDKNPQGDIEIKITGLRSGEKLYEELLIGDNPEKTSHEKIQKINEPFIPFDQLEGDLIKLKNLIKNNQIVDVKNFLEELIPLFKSNSGIIDHIYHEQQTKKIN